MPNSAGNVELHECALYLTPGARLTKSRIRRLRYLHFRDAIILACRVTVSERGDCVSQSLSRFSATPLQEGAAESFFYRRLRVRLSQVEDDLKRSVNAALRRPAFSCIYAIAS
jgi:hypothetical protein